jgi:outer membrane protein TolC
MRWKSLCGGLALLVAMVAGCKQRLFITTDDYDHWKGVSAAALESSPTIHAEPIQEIPPPPPSVRDTDREIRYISLAECIALALENGTVGSVGSALAGAGPVGTESLGTFTGRGFSGTDAIRVLALDPATVGAGIESSLSKFDAVWTTGMNWSATDRPSGTSVDRILAGNLEAIITQNATFNTGVIKPLPTGGVAGITFNLPYTNTNQQAVKNPQYTPQLQFQFEQPLLQGFGVEINQLRASHPGSLINGGVLNTSPTPEGILITRLRFDQQRAEFERNVQIMVTNVEIAYWTLYASYMTQFSRESAVRQAFEAWKINKARYEAGKISIADFAQTRGQYELFRATRFQAVDAVLTAERQLRLITGLPLSDGRRLVPSDEPTLAPFQPNWEAACRDALTLKPELYIARQDVKANQMNVILAKNSLLPDLRFTATYDINGIGTRLDGPVGDNAAPDNNALRNLASNHFNDWALGLRLNVPIGYRNAEANLRIARLQLARSYEILKHQEKLALDIVQQAYQRLVLTYDRIPALRAQREAFAEQLKARFQEFIAGRGTLDIFLEAQRNWADALDQEYLGIRDYNNALVSFEFARGRVLEHDSVVIAEGPLPACAQQRAAEHIRARTLALPVLQRAIPSACPDGPPLLRDVPQPGPVALPSVIGANPPHSDPLLPPANGMAQPTSDPKELPKKMPLPATSKPAVPVPTKDLVKPQPPSSPTPTDLSKTVPTPTRTPEALPPADLLPPSPVPLTREKER